MIKDYIKGKGIVIKLKPSEINNLYRPNSVYKSESFNYVYVKDCINKKFAPILFKEWFFLLKPEGFLIIEYNVNKEINIDFVEKIMWWLFKGNYEIIFHSEKNGKATFIVKKLKSMFAINDSINKWTFGIITNGDRNDWLEQIIASIHKLKIPNYEIIVCGKYKNRNEKNFKYIPFNERSDKGWITKKKNLICVEAQYENLCILHDRLYFNENWFKGMKKYGNAFELLGCIQKDVNTNEQAGDWLTLGGPMNTRYKIARIEYNDWDYNVYLSGQLTILKKSIWKKVLWDETRYWDGAEDADISFRARDLGYIIRFNPFAIIYALTWRHGKLPLKYNVEQGILPKDMLLRRIMRSIGRILYKIPFVEKLPISKIDLIFKSRLYKYFVYH